jgi:hypothetical protein
LEVAIHVPYLHPIPLPVAEMLTILAWIEFLGISCNPISDDAKLLAWNVFDVKPLPVNLMVFSQEFSGLPVKISQPHLHIVREIERGICESRREIHNPFENGVGVQSTIVTTILAVKVFVVGGSRQWRRLKVDVDVRVILIGVRSRWITLLGWMDDWWSRDIGSLSINECKRHLHDREWMFPWLQLWEDPSLFIGMVSTLDDLDVLSPVYVDIHILCIGAEWSDIDIARLSYYYDVIIDDDSTH